MLPHWSWPIIAFLSGSIPFGLLIARAKGVDIRKHGSGNIGATNVGRVLGKPYFYLCFSLDMLKGLLPVLGAGWALGALGEFVVPASVAYWWLGSMICAVLGHVFTPWLGFKGGKGVATALGALLGVCPLLAIPGAFVFLVWFVLLKATRYMSLASMIAGITLPGFITAICVERNVPWRDAAPFVGVGILLALLVIWTHRANIKRLQAGTEPRFGVRIDPSATPTPKPQTIS